MGSGVLACRVDINCLGGGRRRAMGVAAITLLTFVPVVIANLGDERSNMARHALAAISSPEQNSYRAYRAARTAHFFDGA